MGELLHSEDGTFGERPPTATPLPNKADEAWSRLESLRVEARALGVVVDDRWPIARLEQEIAARRASA
jgi:hypothetical protein